MNIKGIVLSLILLIFYVNAWSVEFWESGIYYNIIDSNSVAVVSRPSGVSAYSGTVSIPSTVMYSDREYNVTEIGVRAFEYCTSLTSVVLPDGLLRIYLEAFNGCNALSNVVLPNSITDIGYGAFSGCNITSITIPSSITYLGSRAFAFCSLTSVYFEALVPPTIDSNCFSDSGQTFYIPCVGTVGLSQYQSALNFPSNRIVENFSFAFSAISSDSILGTVVVTQEPTCIQPAIIEAVASNHCHFLRWSDEDSLIIRTLNPTCDTSLVAYFEIDKHSIATDGPNGTVTGGGIYDYGTIISLEAIANDHYYFEKWSDGDTINPRTVKVSGDSTYFAIFEGDLHTITVNGQNGTITGRGQYNYGKTATLTATANQYYHFVKWSDGDTSNPRIITVSGDSTFTAVFEPYKYYVSSNNNLISGTGEYDYGSTVTLIAHSAEHERFVQWADGTTDSVHSFVLSSGDTTIIAFYALDSFNITASCDKGTVSGVGVYAYKDIASIYVEPDKGYRFVEWNDGNVYNPRVFSVEGDLMLEAICEEIPEVCVDDVKDDAPQFYVVGNIIYNPANELLRVYSASGKLLQQSEIIIELTSYPSGVYIVVDERGNDMKVLVNNR